MSYQHLLLATVLLTSPTLAVASSASLPGAAHTWSNDSGGYKGLVKSTQPVTVMYFTSSPSQEVFDATIVLNGDSQQLSHDVLADKEEL